MALSVFAEIENDRRTKVTYLTDMGGILASFAQGSAKTRNKHKTKAPRGVRLSDKYQSFSR